MRKSRAVLNTGYHSNAVLARNTYDVLNTIDEKTREKLKRHIRRDIYYVIIGSLVPGFLSVE